MLPLELLHMFKNSESFGLASLVLNNINVRKGYNLFKLTFIISSNLKI